MCFISVFWSHIEPHGAMWSTRPSMMCQAGTFLIAPDILAPRRSFLSLDLHVVEQPHLHSAVAHARIARKRGGINCGGLLVQRSAFRGAEDFR